MNTLLEAFRQACLDKDWQALAQIDRDLRQQLSESLNACESEQEKRQMITLLQRLQKIYALAMRNAKEDQQEIASELAKLQKDQRAVKAYEQGSRLP